MEAYGRQVASWVVRHGVTGVWLKPVLILVLLLGYAIVLEACIRIACLGRPLVPGCGKAMAFWLVVAALMLAWWGVGASIAS